MIEAALSGSVLILVVLLIRLVCRGKISARFQYALWLLVLVRLLLPVSLGESAFSVLNAVPEQTSAPFTPFPTGQAAAGTDWTGNVEYTYPQDGFIPRPGQNQTTQSAPDSPQVTAQARWTPGDWLNLVWLLGALAVELVFAAENLVCARRLRRGRVPFQGEKSGCLLPVYVAEDLPSPCLFGLARPAIYLTPGAARDGAAVPHILAHEQTHYRHLDHIWPIFRALAVALYWWNPLVWLAAHCSRVDCELACDEGALKVLGEELRFEYGRTLVGLVPVKKTPSGLFRAATTMTGGKRELKQRLNIILKRPKTVLPLLVCAVLAAAAAAGCTFTGAIREEPYQQPSGVADVPDSGLGIVVPSQTQTGRQRREGVYNFVLLGQDKESANTDAIILVSYDTVEQRVSMVSIPRDTIVHRDWSEYLKLNLAYPAQGPDTLKREIENTFGVPVDYYVHIDLNGLAVLVDELGGVDVYIPEDMDYDDPYQDLSIHYAKGDHHLNGQQAMEVVRFRHNNDGTGYTDVGRGEMQRQVLASLAEKVISWNSLTKIQDFVGILQQYVATDLSAQDLVYFASQALQIDVDTGLTQAALKGRGDGRYDSKNQWCYVFQAEDILPTLNATVNPYSTELTEADLDLPVAESYFFEDDGLQTSANPLENVSYQAIPEERQGQ